jgi:MFS family permease
MLRNRTLLAISVAVAAAYTGIGMVGPVRVLYARSQGASLAIISAMASAYLISNFIAQYPSGWLADRWGKRRTMMVGLLLQAALSLLYVVIVNPLVFVALRFAEGIAAAAVLPAARALVADAIPVEKRGEAYGIFSAFFNAGFLIGPALGGALATTGYASAFIGAVVFRLVAVAVVVTLVPRTVQVTQIQVESAGKAPLHALFAMPLLGAYVLAFGDYLYLGFDLALMPLWMHDHLGASVGVIGLAYVTWAIPSILMSPIGGRIADRRRRSALILVFGLAQVPLYVSYGLARSAWLVVGLFAVHALVYALIQPAVDAHVAAASPVQSRGRIQGMYTTVGLFGAAVGASALTVLYAIDFRLPLFALGAGYGLCVLAGGLLVRLAEARGQVIVPTQGAAQGSASAPV